MSGRVSSYVRTVGRPLARQRLAVGRRDLHQGMDTAAPGGSLPVTALQIGHLLNALDQVLGFEAAAGGDGVFA